MRAATALAALIGTSCTAFAGGGFDIVIPGRPGVPIIINGVDASYAVVEGEWGLGRGGQVQPTIYGGRYIDPRPNVGHYYPSAGHLPGYGRVEIQPPANRKLPQPAESYHQSWSARSAPPAAPSDLPFYPPPVIVAPPIDAGPQDWRR
ncbi:hypothetical protein [Bradyrhizobium sp.]|uniref:hypothetical protein n=1 Tax=Bradyrhizobium sp. TaxID=376 RepID=UPI000AE77926|nr:hypothetical protein [Bradyrhizobium sp.]